MTSPVPKVDGMASRATITVRAELLQSLVGFAVLTVLYAGVALAAGLPIALVAIPAGMGPGLVVLRCAEYGWRPVVSGRATHRVGDRA